MTIETLIRRVGYTPTDFELAQAIAYVRCNTAGGTWLATWFLRASGDLSDGERRNWLSQAHQVLVEADRWRLCRADYVPTRQQLEAAVAGVRGYAMGGQIVIPAGELSPKEAKMLMTRVRQCWRDKAPKVSRSLTTQPQFWSP